MHLSSLCGKSNLFLEKTERDLQELAKSDLPMIIFGTGSRARQFAYRFRQYSIPINAFCETAAYYRPGKFVDGIPVYSYEKLCTSGIKCNLVVAASGIGMMEAIGSPQIANKVYFFEGLPGWFCMTPEWVSQHIELLDDTYHLLADEASKTVFLSLIETRTHCLTISVPPLPQLGIPGQYFNSFYDPKYYRENALIDCGAYTGDSAESYLSFVYAHGQRGKVYAFEPDTENFRKLKITANKVKTAGIGEVVCFPYAVGASKKKICFTDRPNGWGVETSDGGNQKEMITLDDLLCESSISMVKMDLEGGELSALKGARKIISEQLPFLAICVYHRIDDLITIPQFIRETSRETQKGYKFYLRHHSTGLHETVLYAVPE